MSILMRGLRYGSAVLAALCCFMALAVVPAQGQGDAVGGASDASRTHLVQRGDTLVRVARKYGVPVHELAAANHLRESSRLRQGARLRIPDAPQEEPNRIALHTEEVRTASVNPLAPALPSRKPAAAPKRISLNFSNVEVRQALATISDYAGVDILVTPSGAGALSISLRNRTADEAIRLTAAAAALSVAKVGGVYIVGKPEEVRKAIGEFGKSEMVSLRTATFQEAKDLLARVAPLVAVEAAGSGVVLSGLPDDLATAQLALRDLDANHAPAPAPKQITDVLSLRFMDPATGERVLHQAFPDLRIARHDRTLILSGMTDTLTAAGQAIKQMDVEPVAVAAEPEVLVYRLKYANAHTAEATLKKALPGVNVTIAPEPTAPPAAAFQPLNGGFGMDNANGSSGGSSGGSGGGQSGGQSGASGAGAGATGGAPAQQLSRSVRLILIGPHAEVERGRLLLEQTDVAPPLVRIEAALVEVNRTDMKDLGLKWDFTNTGFTFTVPGGNGVEFRGDPKRSSTSFSVALKALINENKARVLASPNISVVDNEDANIFIGDLLRFRGINVVTPNAGTVQGTETIAVGIALLVRPRVHPDGEVTLKVHPVVSSVASFVDGLPQTSSREADTTMRLKSGEEMVIGGLSRKEFTTALQKVPLLGDLPVIGEFFRNRTHNATETEILIFLRVYPVQSRPAPADQSGVLPEGAVQGSSKSILKGEIR